MLAARPRSRPAVPRWRRGRACASFQRRSERPLQHRRRAPDRAQMKIHGALMQRAGFGLGSSGRAGADSRARSDNDSDRSKARDRRCRARSTSHRRRCAAAGCTSCITLWKARALSCATRVSISTTSAAAPVSEQPHLGVGKHLSLRCGAPTRGIRSHSPSSGERTSGRRKPAVRFQRRVGQVSPVPASGRDPAGDGSLEPASERPATQRGARELTPI